MYCHRCHRRYETDELFCPHDGERLLDRPHAKHVRSKPTDLQGNIVAGRYQIRGLLGRGALSQVLLAKDMKTAEPVALKLLEARHLKEAKTRARFVLEAKAMADVVHPNVATVLDVGLAEDGTPFIVIEYLLGESLGTYLRRQTTLDARTGVPLLRQLAAGVAAAHGAGIIHRDIKPDNVFFVGEVGSPHTAKIVDFGLAKVAEQRGLTAYGVAVGTIHYMAPEQAIGDDVDPRTDVYGFGLLMYRAIVGRVPFNGEDEAEVLARQVFAPTPPLGATGAERPAGWTAQELGDVAAIIAKATRKVKANRYPSIQALADDLAKVGVPGAKLAAKAPLATPEDVYEPASPFSVKAAAFLKKRLT